MVSLLVAALWDDRFYPSASELGSKSPAAIGLIGGKMCWARAIVAR